MATTAPPTGFSFALARQRLAWLNQRQAVLANNIANANTPQYKARDLAPFQDALDRAQFAITPLRTNMNDLPPLPDATGFALAPPAESGPDGNDVQLDAQLIKVANTETDQQAATAITNTYIALFRTALGR